MMYLKKSLTSSRQDREQGFTLIELLIAITMLSFVLLLVATTFIQINRAYTGGITTKRVHEEARVALGSITNDFRTASSGSQVQIYCGGDPTCKDDAEVATQALCFDQKAYIFDEDTKRLAFTEGVSCDDFDSIELDSGTSQFGDLLQVQFFRVSELVPAKTYNIEIAVSTASHTDDLLTELDSGDSIRDLGCDPSQPGNQYCRVVFVNSIVTIRGD